MSILTDETLSTEGLTLSEKEAVVGILLATTMVRTNGKFDKEDQVPLMLLIMRQLRLFSFPEDCAEEALQALKKVLAVIQAKGTNELVSLCKTSLTKEIKESVFILACDEIMSRGLASDQINEFITMLQAEFEIDAGLADKTTEVLAIKRGPS